MSGRIPQSFIDDLVSRVDIVDVIDKRVPLKKAGHEYKACCPFHDEKTPSFTVSPSKQFYHCFGCGAHGTAIGFLLEYEHLDFVEAVEQLAQSLGLEVPREGGESAPRGPSHAPLYALMDKAARYYQHQLRQHPQRDLAVNYLKNRGLSGEIAKDFGIGYAPDGWDNLLSTLGTDEQERDRLLQVGMIIEKDNGRHYDRFRQRIMFPIRDARGRVIAFGGRIIDSDGPVDAKAGGPKYLNSPETPIFHKGKELYGLYETRQALRDIPRLVVVEGYMDVVALAQYGIRNAVATLGTAVTPDHLEKLFRVSNEVVFCFDGDRAGRDAGWRGLENGLSLIRNGRQLRFMFLPEGDDPDTFVRHHGRDAFEKVIAEATPLSDFFFQQLIHKTDIGSIDGRARLVELARPYLAQLPPGAFRQLMQDRLAELSHLDSAALSQVLNGAAPKTPAETTARTAIKPRTTGQKQQAPSTVRRAIELLLQEPKLAQTLEKQGPIGNLHIPGIGLLLEILELLQAHPKLTTAGLLEHWRGTENGRHLAKLAQRNSLLDGDEVDLQQEFRDAMQRLNALQAEQRREELAKKTLKELSDEEKQELARLSQQKH